MTEEREREGTNTGEDLPPYSVLETLRLRSGRTEFPSSQFWYPYAGKREGEEVGNFAVRASSEVPTDSNNLRGIGKF